MLVAFWALVGWCGTPWPRRWPLPPPPPPDPWLLKAVNIAGGVLGGWAFTQVWPAASMGPIEVAASGIGALVGAVALGDLAGFALPRKG